MLNELVRKLYFLKEKIITKTFLILVNIKLKG